MKNTNGNPPEEIAQHSMNKEDLQTIVELSTHGIWEWNCITNEVYYSPSFKRMFGYADDEVPNTPDFWQNTIHPEDLVLVLEKLNQHIETQGSSSYSQEVRYRHKNGSTVYVRCSGRVVEWTEDLQPKRMVGSHVDVTSLRNAELEANKMKDLLHRTGQIAKVGGWEVDCLTQKIWWSDVTREIHEVPLGFDHTIHSAIDFFEEDTDREAIRRALQNAIEKGESYDLELRFRTAKGNLRWVRTVGTPYRENGKTIRVSGTLQDITASVKLRLHLQRERDFSRSLLENLNSGFSMVNEEGVLVDVNSALCDMTGYSRDELIGCTQPYPYWHPDEFEGVQQSFARVRAGDFSFYELRFQHKNGDSIWVEVTPSKVFDESTGQTLYNYILTNVSERKRSEARYRFLIEHSHDMIWTMSKDGTFTFVSPSWEKICGHPTEFMHGKHFTAFLHPDEHDVCQQYLDSVSQARESLPGPAYRIIKSDGTWRWHEGAVTPVFDDNSLLTSFVGVSRDITERKQAEEALKASEMRFKEILQGVQTVAVQGYGMDGTVRYWNEASTILYGYTEEEALGRNLLDLIIPPNLKDIVRNRIRSMVETHQPIPAAELTLMRKDRSLVTVFSSHSLVELPGKAAEFFCIDVDINDRKELEDALRRAVEKAEAANQAKTRFLANMSHELRTPMNGVLGMTELLMDSQLDTEQRHYADMIKSSGEDLLNIIEDLLNFAKIEAGKIQLVNEAFELSEFIDLIAAKQSLKAVEKGLHFKVIKDPRLPEAAVGDAGRLRQVLLNFLSNAIKFTHHGGITLRVEPEGEGKADAGMLRFTVEDTGIGIAEQQLESIFERFSQADNSFSRQYGGTGLGLAIAKDLTALMGGTVSVKSTLGNGSAFSCTVPFAMQANDNLEAPQLEPESKNGLLHTQAEVTHKYSGRVLLAEDNAVNQLVAQAMLKAVGLQVEVVENGEQALEAFNEAAFDLILMDLQMPEMNGLDATHAIRQREAAAAKPHDKPGRIPIVAFTAHASEEDKQMCIEAGMDDYLAKPIMRNALEIILKRWLDEEHQP